MMKSLCAGALMLLLASSPAWAEPESWYTYWGLGVSDNHYPKAIQDSFDAIESLPDVERTEGAIDMLGFYWPIFDNPTIVGVVVSGSFDRVDDGDQYLQLNQYLYSASAMRFFGKEPGRGFFLRGDIGIAKAVTETNFAGDSVSDSGFGYLIGTGYGIPASAGTRLLLNINYSSKTIESDAYSAVMLTIAGMW